ncbi:MAG: diguanylate cyclase [Planctomycetota bacterium]
MQSERPFAETEHLLARIRDLEGQLERSRANELQLRARLAQALEELQQSNQLIDSAPMPVLLLDRSGRITDANDAAEELVGRPEAALVGVSVEEFVVVGQGARWREAMEKVLGGQPFRGAEQFFADRADGSKVILYPYRDAEGDVVGVVVTEDVEELKDSRSTLEFVNSELKDLVNRDPLTQVANRRAYENALRRESSRCARRESPLAILMIDVDHFKEFNDSCGHQAGDQCLRQIAKALGNSIRRPGDLLARYGGEEFVAMLPETDLEGARYVAARMRAAVASLQIEHPTQDRPVTVSLGVCVAVPKPGESAQVLVDRADRALYHAKNSGRDRVVVAMERGDKAVRRSVKTGDDGPVFEVDDRAEHDRPDDPSGEGDG